MFTKACEYGIRASVHISHKSHLGERASLKAVAKAIDSPVAFTAKILQSLAKNNLIISTQGPTGGYEMMDKNAITLLQIVSAIDGDAIYNGCGLGLKQCNEEKPCPLHFKYKAIRDDLTEMLQKTTISELAKTLNKGTAFLKI